jgi:hypothetical protein
MKERALAPGRFPSAGDQRTNDTRFPPSPRHRGDGDAPHLPSVTNYPVPPRHPRAESRLMSYSRERGSGGPGSGEGTGRLRRQVNNKRMRKKLVDSSTLHRREIKHRMRWNCLSSGPWQICNDEVTLGREVGEVLQARIRVSNMCPRAATRMPQSARAIWCVGNKSTARGGVAPLAIVDKTRISHRLNLTHSNGAVWSFLRRFLNYEQDPPRQGNEDKEIGGEREKKRIAEDEQEGKREGERKRDGSPAGGY